MSNVVHISGSRPPGLRLGETMLIRSAEHETLSVERDSERCLALLSVLCRRQVGPEALHPIEAAAHYWASGDKALANLRLVFAGLPRIAEPADAARLQAAAYCLDQGMAPRDLMKALDLDASVLNKFDPDQPRVPAGNGQESGQWTRGTDEAQSGRSRGSAANPHRIRVAANGPFKPDGIETVPSPPVDPLDPANLNKEPPSPQEQQAIADTLSIIFHGTPEEIKTLRAHDCQNIPEKITGAVLPLDQSLYRSYSVNDKKDRETASLILNKEKNRALYTANHYLNFYGVDINK